MMKTTFKQTREKIHIGPAVTYENLCIFPLISSQDSALNYLGMKTALTKKLIEIQEISEAGSVPDLNVVNHSELPVLIVDGEELAGAKQNRIANTSILLAAGTTTKIPVSCTEQGRWRYNSRSFSDSGIVMSSRARVSKNHRVSSNLKQARGFDAEQREVWRDVESLHFRGSTRSDTHAMKDAYELKQKQITAYVQAFPLEAGQKGMIVFMNGELAGMDYVSRFAAYADVHEKFLKSHAIEALTEIKTGWSVDGFEETAEMFLDNLLTLPATEHPSVGLGKDFRLEGPDAGSAMLTFGEEVVHWNAFPSSMIDNPGRYIG
ncbi:ARPP-1 family domain-containing protein [Flavilitoribacter nigricans]|uniref:ARG and Rhodanese-Phosphatase-superfamily-associated domain-containing protein n=1 Tax=Flavilitoribacter nigricans (strain ATCC 23147 / DSM 23189 / NBRC 102662 / NCIMB 1420 / SS-2) TaxID=1122177 RepID=A0A2D0N1K4_FLAN2|nr:DUF6569 family protein [Flavilitoribacter nigricans]PHN02411.1 hypothetical protein CRP01_32020 [Flavilitoribacter nigricans DSM 23189 = NBRC 102662]